MSNTSTPQRTPNRSPRASLIPDEQQAAWSALQLSLAGKADLSDARLGFDCSALLGDDAALATKMSAAVGSISTQARPVAAVPTAMMQAPPASTGTDSAPASTPSSSSSTLPPLPPLRLIGGLDISFVKDTKFAVASLVVLDAAAKKEPFPVVYEDMLHCTMDVPYVPGFLAFREVAPIQQLVRRIKERAPQFVPQVYLVDGCGVLHHRKCGLATHFGVTDDVPIFGCAKNLLAVDGLDRDVVTKRAVAAAAGAEQIPGAFTYRGVSLVPLVGESGFTYGYSALTGNSSAKPIFISPGHRISARTAAMLAVRLAAFRVVEPIRQADLRSRAYIAKNLTMHEGGEDDE